MNFIYTLLYIFLFIPFFVFINKKRGYKLDLKDRLSVINNKYKNVYWFHCASVGELNVAEPLINHFIKRNKNVLITVFSPRGVEFARKKFPRAEIRALPFDLKFILKKFINKYRPKVLFLVEEEYWFNLIDEVSKKNIPIVSINSRISEKSFKFYKRFHFFYKKIFNKINRFLVRSEFDMKFFKLLVDNKKLKLCGDLKFLSSKTTKNVDLVIKRKPILVLGSTHYPEEEIFLDIYPSLKEIFPKISLIIAPRHLERVEEIEELIKSKGFSYKKRSESKVVDTDIYILNTLGELGAVYKYADVVFVGGTIADVGGHNVLEPACLGKPIIVGRNIYKVKSNALLLHKLGILYFIERRKDIKTLVEKLIKDKEKNKNIKEKLKKYSKNVAKCYVRELKRFFI